MFNNLVACAYTTGRIEIKSDGTPWRPVHATSATCARPSWPAWSAGRADQRGIRTTWAFPTAITASANWPRRPSGQCPAAALTFTGEHGKDSRTYRVSFRRILGELKDYFRPEWDLDRGGRELVEFFRQVGFTEEHFAAGLATGSASFVT